MKKLLFIASLFAVSFVACKNDNAGGDPALTDGELAFSPKVADLTEGALSRSGTGEFFTDGYVIDVTLATNHNATPQKFEYSYRGGGIFRGSPPFYFNLDDTYITNLKAIWPSQAVRDQGLVTDQREIENFRRADWLTAEATSQNIMPTDAPVPLYFERENAMLEFEIAGQNAEGIDIKELVIELQVNNKAEAFWAYCGDDNGHAMVILDSTVVLASDESYMIGRMSVTDNYEYTIIFPPTDLKLENGKRYLVTLTAQGYDVDDVIYIGTFTQDEESGIGIPFASPEMNADGNFVITEPEQLIGMSYLIRHYPHPSTYVWTNSTYVISDNLIVTDEVARLYIPIPRGDFNGSIRSEGGTELTSLTYDGDQVLELYE